MGLLAVADGEGWAVVVGGSGAARDKLDKYTGIR